MRVMVIDGHGGGIGAAVIKALRQALGNDLDVLAVGANSIATSTMMKAGANRGATGENAIVCTSRTADVIVGPLAVLMADSMMGEITQTMAGAVSRSNAHKVLIPLTRERVTIVGVPEEPLPHLVDRAVTIIRELLKNRCLIGVCA